MKFIFKIKIKNCSEEEYVSFWKRVSEIVKNSDGSKGSVICKKLDEDGVFIAIAEWESKELRDQAMIKLKENKEYNELMNKNKSYADIEILGNFDEFDKVD